MDRIDKFLDDLEETFAYIREREGGDSVCGLCEYDGAYIGESGDWYNECPGFEQDDCFKLKEELRKKRKDEILAICRNVGNCSEIPNNSDAVSRRQALDAVRRLQTYKLFEGDDMLLIDKAEAQTELMMLPSAQPEKEIPKRVLWRGWKGMRDTRYKCPNCKKPVRNTDIYCHRCGQKLMFPNIDFTPYVEGQKQELIVRWDDEE